MTIIMLISAFNTINNSTFATCFYGYIAYDESYFRVFFQNHFIHWSCFGFINWNGTFNYQATNTAFDNLINIIESRETKEEAIRLLAMHLMLHEANPSLNLYTDN
jgi:hypothetical protein